MKKIICILIALIMCAACASCSAGSENRSGTVNNSKTVDDVLKSGAGGTNTETEAGSGSSSSDTVKDDGKTYDVDLTEMNSTMVYSEVNQMVTKPDDFLGKTVKMNGTFTYGKGEDRYYFACLIADATACCAQGIEFVLENADLLTFPNDYPKVGDEIVVTGVFDTYYEGEYRYCQLIDATLYS